MNTWGPRGGCPGGVTHREAQHADEEDRAGRSERGDHRGWFFLETGRLTPWFARVPSDGGAGALIFMHSSREVSLHADTTLGLAPKFHIFSKRANGDLDILEIFSKDRLISGVVTQGFPHAQQHSQIPNLIAIATQSSARTKKVDSYEGSVSDRRKSTRSKPKISFSKPKNIKKVRVHPSAVAHT